MKKNNTVREKTYKAIKYNLNKYHKTTLIRPTGFGKTFMLSDLVKDYKSVLFLYPTVPSKEMVVENVAKRKGYLKEEYMQLADMDNIHFMTYSKLIRLTADDFKDMKYDLVVCDECHRLGANKTKDAIALLQKYNPKIKMIGATATPNRSDAFDVVNNVFDNVNTFEYTLHDAFKDGLLQRPYYVYCTYDPLENVKYDVAKEIKKSNIRLAKDELVVLNKKVIEIANLYNIENIIKSACNEVLKGDTYMKFICFFTSFKHLDEKSKDIIKWFSAAFPNYKINTVTITSENNVTMKNVQELRKLTRKNNTIDLIFCIDMLNMGYHVDDLTGVIMYRTTSSNIIYIQQLGRALHSNPNSKSLVIDLVDNIERKALYDKYDRNTLEQTYQQRKKQEKIDAGEYVGVYTDVDNYGNEIELNEYERYDHETGKIVPKWTHNTQLLREDLVGTGYEASYKQLIKKIVAEPIIQRCKMAFANHFRYWCNEHNVPFPITDKELRETYGLNKDEFNEYFYNLVKTHRLNYPLGDANKLLEKNSGLDLIARVWNLTAEQVLKEIL